MQLRGATRLEELDLRHNDVASLPLHALPEVLKERGAEGGRGSCAQ